MVYSVDNAEAADLTITTEGTADDMSIATTFTAKFRAWLTEVRSS